MTRRVWRTGFIALLTFAAAQGLQAAQPCRTSDDRGVFSAIVVGNFVVTPPGIPVGPTARIGRVEKDGNGNAKIQATLSLNGAILEESYQGVYTVNPDCTEDVTLFIPFPGAPQPIPFKFSGMLVDDGREATYMLVDPPGSTVRLTLRKQRKDDCSNRDLLGAYVLNMSGTNVFQPGSPTGLFARVGRLKFDGIGAFTASTSASYGGQIQSETFSGAYAIDSSCIVQLAFRNGVNYSWVGMLMDNGAGVNLLVTDPPGAVITGALKQE